MKTDTQRSKVYNAEMAVRAQCEKASRNVGVVLKSVPDIERYVAKLCARKRVAAKYRQARYGIRVKDGRGRRNACGGGGVITLPLWARTEVVILHEVAHCFAGTSYEHNWQFVDCFLFLVREMMGVESHDILKASMRKHNAKWAPPRTRAITEEKRAELVERLAANRRQFTKGRFMIRVEVERHDGAFSTYWVRRGSSHFGATASWDYQSNATIWTTREGAERFAAKHCSTNRASTKVTIVDLDAPEVVDPEPEVPADFIDWTEALV